METTKNTCYGKGEDALDHSAVKRWFKKFCTSCKNLNDQAKSDGPKIVFQGWVSSYKSKSSTKRVSNKFCILQSNMVCHLQNYS